MNTVNALIDKNNKTLAFIELKDYANAVQSSLSALSYQQRDLGFIQNSHKQSDASISLDQCMMLLSGEACNPLKSTENAQHQSFVFDQGILLPSTITDAKIITPVLIFNTALTHHLLQDGTLATLQRAKRLYELAYGAGGATPQSILFRFAAINNLAVIERQLGNMEQSDIWFQGLLSTYMQLLDQGNTEILRFMQGFLSNVLFENYSGAA